MVVKFLAPAVAAVFLLGACSSTGPKQGVGTVAGAAGGALLGSQFGSGTGQLVAVGLGTLLGAFVGSEIGASLDATDRLQADRAAQQAYAAPVGQAISWENPNSGNHGTVTTLRQGVNNQTGSYCREYQQTVYVGGRSEQAHGVACQQPDGSWKIVN
ncbi:MAG: glycine zipper 2TM domain-containing protein [Azospirillum sp.]|nr:glycine zipper 2TM domain-containing protein [Azospirillum sp.]